VNCTLALSVSETSRSRLCLDWPRVHLSGPAYMPSCIRPEHGRRKEGQGGYCPPWILKLLAKKLFLQCRGVKNLFHHFWPPLEKNLGKSPTGLPLEEILPTPMDKKPNFYLINVFCVVIVVQKCRLLCQAQVSSLILYCIAARYLWCLRPKLHICAACCSDSLIELIA